MLLCLKSEDHGVLVLLVMVNPVQSQVPGLHPVVAAFTCAAPGLRGNVDRGYVEISSDTSCVLLLLISGQ